MRFSTLVLLAVASLVLFALFLRAGMTDSQFAIVGVLLCIMEAIAIGIGLSATLGARRRAAARP